jgi:hypothetical protein
MQSGIRDLAAMLAEPAALRSQSSAINEREPM